MQEESVENEKQVDDLKQKTCFVVMPIADVTDYAPGHFKRVFEYIIEPACRGLGYKAIKANDVKSSHIIMIDILKRILEADMVVCDLSSRNPNVLYELAVRQCFDLPVTLIKDNETREPFDVAGIRYTEYDKQLRVDRVKEDIVKVQDSIRETEEMKNEDVFSLIQLLGRQKAEAKDTNVDPTLLAILQQVNRIVNQQNSVSSLTYDYNDAFIPIEQVVDNIFPGFGTRLILDVEQPLYIGASVVHNVTGREGIVVGVGKFQAQPALIVQVDDGPLVAAKPTMYTKMPD